MIVKQFEELYWQAGSNQQELLKDEVLTLNNHLMYIVYISNLICGPPSIPVRELYTVSAFSVTMATRCMSTYLNFKKWTTENLLVCPCNYEYLQVHGTYLLHKIAQADIELWQLLVSFTDLLVWEWD